MLAGSNRPGHLSYLCHTRHWSNVLNPETKSLESQIKMSLGVRRSETNPHPQIGLLAAEPMKMATAFPLAKILPEHHWTEGREFGLRIRLAPRKDQLEANWLRWV